MGLLWRGIRRRGKFFQQTNRPLLIFGEGEESFSEEFADLHSAGFRHADTLGLLYVRLACRTEGVVGLVQDAVEDEPIEEGFVDADFFVESPGIYFPPSLGEEVSGIRYEDFFWVFSFEILYQYFHAARNKAPVGAVFLNVGVLESCLVVGDCFSFSWHKWRGGQDCSRPPLQRYVLREDYITEQGLFHRPNIILAGCPG